MDELFILHFCYLLLVCAGVWSGVLQEVLSLLGAVSGEARLNVCELGVVLGLPRWSVRGALLEEVGVGDGDQLEALVDLFLQKTQDAPLLLSRVRQCNVQSRYPFSSIYGNFYTTFYTYSLRHTLKHISFC